MGACRVIYAFVRLSPKAAVNLLTEAWAAEYDASGACVNAVSPTEGRMRHINREIDVFALIGMSHASHESITMLHYGCISSGFDGSRLQEFQTIQLELRSDRRATSATRAADSCRRSTGEAQVPKTSWSAG